MTVITNNTTDSVTREKMDGIEILRFPCFNLINGRFPIPNLIMNSGRYIVF